MVLGTLMMHAAACWLALASLWFVPLCAGVAR